MSDKYLKLTQYIAAIILVGNEPSRRAVVAIAAGERPPLEPGETPFIRMVREHKLRVESISV